MHGLEERQIWSSMLSIPNLISLTRVPLVLFFLQESPLFRCLALVLALLSDVLDGYIARKYCLSSRLGALLDPITDKFFVAFVLVILIQENQITLGEAAAMVSRDFAIVLFGLYLAFLGRFSTYCIRAIWSGKVTTFLQLSVLFGLICHIALPAYTFAGFVLLGICALIELCLRDRSQVKEIQSP